MTLDDNWRAAAQRQADREAAQARADWEAEALLESEEAEEERWRHIHARQTVEEWQTTTYDDGPDRRVFSVSGSRRPIFPGDDAA